MSSTGNPPTPDTGGTPRVIPGGFRCGGRWCRRTRRLGRLGPRLGRLGPRRGPRGQAQGVEEGRGVCGVAGGHHDGVVLLEEGVEVQQWRL